MATKPQSIETESAHFNNFSEYYPRFKTLDADTVQALLGDGTLQVSTAFEQALANVNGTHIVNEDCCDLSDGSDAKLVTSQYHRGRIDATVSNIKNKTGKLRVQVLEQHTGEFYYFVIPHYAYRHLKHGVEICFDLMGMPKRNTKWWAYEVSDFEELAKK